jgi:hypothetical protein
VGKARIIEWRKAVASPLILVFGSEEYFYSSAIRRIRDELKNSQAGDLQEVRQDAL